MEWDALEVAKELAKSPDDPNLEKVIALAQKYPTVLSRTVHLQPLFITLADRVAACAPSESTDQALEALAIACQTCPDLSSYELHLKHLLARIGSKIYYSMPLTATERLTAPVSQHPEPQQETLDVSSETRTATGQSYQLDQFDHLPLDEQVQIVRSWNSLDKFEQACDSCESLLTNPELRVEVCKALKSLIGSFEPKIDLPDLRGNSHLAQWIRGCLQSSNYTLRSLTTEIIGLYMLKGSDKAQARTVNFLVSLGLNSDGDISLETILRAWTEAGVYSEDEALERVILQFVTALKLPLIAHTLAAHHMRILAIRRNVTPWQLCSPFWRTVSLDIVRECATDLNFVDRFCSILAVSRADLLLRTVQWTLPDLCLKDERFPAIEMVAEALGKSKERLCLDKFPSITANLLIQRTTRGDSYTYAERRFLHLCPVVRNVGFDRLVQSNLVDLVYELLNLAPSEDKKENTTIINVLKRVAVTLPVSSVLYLVYKFSETMRNLQGRQPYTTKRQCVRGLGVLIVMYPQECHGAIRQIVTFFQAALETPQLVINTMRVWRILIETLDKTVVAEIVDLTFSYINQKYHSWPNEAQQCCKAIVRTVFDKCPSEPSSITWPSLIDELAMGKYFIVRSPEQELLDALKRVEDQENKYVARQTIQDIISYCLSIDGSMSDDYAGKIIRLLVDFAGKYDGDIPDMCGQVMGMIGAVDPSKVTLPPHKTPVPPVTVQLLKSDDEGARFAAHIVKFHLLKSFEAAVDPAMQQFLAYGIQELLKVMGMTCLDDLKSKFEETAIAQSLEPFLTTKYTLNGGSNGESGVSAPRISYRTYPIFDWQISYYAWLEAFSYDQMCRASGTIGRSNKIFDICRKVSRADPELWAVLLGPASLVAVTESLDNRRAFLTEVSVILGNPVATVDTDLFHCRVFAILDYFATWMQERRQQELPFLGVDQLLNEISASVMAQRSFECHLYPRAIRYYEETIRAHLFEHENHEKEIWESLRLMYAEMQDIDALEGVSSRFATMTVKQQVLGHRAASNWDAALVCYDVLGKWDDIDRLESLQKSGRERDVLMELKMKPELADIAVECAWSIGDWDALREWARFAAPDSVTGLFGRALVAIKDRDIELLPVILEDARHILVTKMLPDPASITSLTQIRTTQLYLHALADLESIAALTVVPKDRVMLPSQKPDVMSQHQEVSEILDRRLDRVGSNFEAQRFLLGVRRAAFTIAKTDWAPNQMRATYLLEAKFARKFGKNSRIALDCVLQAGSGGIVDTGISFEAVKEHACLLWSEGEARQAIQMLKTGIDPNYFDKSAIKRISAINSARDGDKVAESARNFLKYTVWLDQAAQAPAQDLVTYYNTVTKVTPRWAKAHYHQGKYHSRLYDGQPEANARNDGTWALLIVQAYTKCLELDPDFKHVGECLPRLLTIWLDLGQKSVSEYENPTGIAYLRNKSDRATQVMAKWAAKVSTRVLYQGLSQLLSRLHHPNDSVAKVMVTMIRKIAEAYPAQCLWYLFEVTESSDNVRRKRSSDIMKELTTSLPEVERACRFVDSLRKLCTYRHLRTDETKVRLAQLPFAASTLPCELAVPFQSQMERGLPVDEVVTVYKIDDKVKILASMQRPKRVVFWGNNGCAYPMLLKGTDDVRKDARLVEFTSAVNSLLFADPESRSRQLAVILYRVTPLSDKSGIIEWVPGAEPARSIIDQRLQARNLKVSLRKLMSDFDIHVSVERKLTVFKKLLTSYPPVLYEWYLETFPEPVAWLAARTRYARSLAVMSMVGYILGLGDRHLENILLLKDSGSVLHVDFECLFDKGQDLKFPEIVPFRLTPNLVDALGVVSGYEGTYRRVCELTLKLLRGNQDLLMTILEAFVHDPVVLSKGRTAEQALSSTRDRLRGVKTSDTAPLSVGGQVEDLIRQAVDPKNLCQMYIGWAAFL